MKFFLSSTYEDLREHRAKAAQAIERLGQHGVRMEIFGARPGDATEVVTDEIARSDALVGIYAHRYGFVPIGASKSITQQELEFAQIQLMPIFAFVVDEDFPWPPKYVEGEPGRSNLKKFKEIINNSVVRDTFTTPDELGYKVASALGRFLITKSIKEKLDQIPLRDHVSTASGRDQVSRRAARLESIIRGSRILLVNDVPSEMFGVITILDSLGVDVSVTTTTAEAVQRASAKSFDTIISDMRRGVVIDEGIKLLTTLRGQGQHPPVIFTVGQYQPDRGTPPYAFGITNRVDDLLNLIFDALERRRG
jgi:CheY-like chemotaxis protein